MFPAKDARSVNTIFQAKKKQFFVSKEMASSDESAVNHARTQARGHEHRFGRGWEGGGGGRLVSKVGCDWLVSE